MNERVIFDAALEIADPQARRAFVEKACAGDPAMLAAVESLLKSHDAAGSFLDIPVARQMQSAAPSNPSEPSAADEKTRTYQPGAIDDDSIDDADSQPDLSFLQPSSKPGSIGLMAHYEILSVLGQGAFGIVFKAFDEKLHRLVAIKVMNPQLAATSPPRKRFLREARAAAAIRHENVVQVYSVEEQPLPYLVMEFIDGQTLNDKLNGSGPLETPEVLHIGRQIASGLAAAQTMGLIHRDIKPANILLEQSSEQRVKISDFGLARAADDASMTRTGVISGTPMYMAPEQATGQTLDHRADLFSFGSVLYQMACGRPPFRAANTIAVLRRVVEDTPRPLQEILPEIPDWLVAIVTKLHAKNPADRYQSAKEVGDLLARCQSELQLNGKVTCVPMPHDERSRHAPRDEPNAPSTPISQLTSTNATPSTTPSTPSETSTSTPRSAHHAERDGYVNRQRSNVARYLIAATLITVIVGLTLKPWQNDRTVTNSKSSTPPSPSPSWHGWPADAPPPAIAPFNAEQAQQHQEAWAKYLGVPVEYTNTIGMKFRLIPPGEFMMGSTPEEVEAALKDVDPNDKRWQECIKSEAPQHKVILTQPIYLGVNEVTQAEYEKVMGVNPSHFAPMGAGKAAVAGLETADHPVENVSWNDAAEFCAKLSQQEKLKPFYFRAGETITPLDGTGYRLPSEAEWECACRAGTATKYWVGDQDLERAGWLGGNSGGRTHATGGLNANPFGLYDIYGNVWEWVQDGWDASWYGQFQEKPTINPSSPFPAGSQHVLRSAYWYDTASGCRSSNRHANFPTYRDGAIGFRVSLPIDAVRQALKVTGPAMPKAVATTPSAPALDPIDFAAERQAAEWVLSVGGQLQLIDGSGNRNDPVDGKLPDTPFAVQAITIINGVKVKDDDLARLARCRRLGILTLFGFSGNGSGLSHLAAVRSLRQLDILGSGHISDSGLQALSSLSQIRSLKIDYCPNLTDQCLTHVGHLVALENLLLGSTPVGDAGVKHLSQLSRLRRHVVGSRVTDAGIRQLLEQHPNLETLGIFDPDGSERTLMFVGASRSLKELEVSGNQITADGLRVLQAMPTLRTLHVIQPTTADVVLRIAEVPQLREVQLHFSFGDRPSPGDAALAALARLPHLERIIVAGDEPSPGDSVLEAWAGIPNLKSVTLQHNEGKRHYTPAGIAKFRELRPDVQLNIDGKNYPATATEAPINFPAERKAAERLLKLGKGKVTLGNKDRQPIGELKDPLPGEPFCILRIDFGSADLTDEDLTEFAGCRAIESLVLHGNRRVTATGLKSLGSLPYLKELYIGDTVIGDEVIAWLKDLPSLTTLFTQNAAISAAGWESMPPCRQLKHIITSPQVGDAGLHRIVEQCPALEVLLLADGSIGDLTPLARLTHFKHLHTGQDVLDDDGIDTLLKLPNLDTLAIDYPVSSGLARLRRLGPKLAQLSLRDQRDGSRLATSESWASVTEMGGLRELIIGGAIAVDGPALRRIAAMPNLRRLAVSSGEMSAELKATLHTYTADDIAAFRKARPDVQLNIDGQEYPATK